MTPARVTTAALAVLAALALVLGGVLTARARPSDARESGPLLQRAGVRVSLTPGWSLGRPDSLLGYADTHGEPVATVRGAAVLDAGACRDDPGSMRGFVGIAAARDGPVPGRHHDQVRRWVAGLAAATGGEVAVTPLGASAQRARTDLRVVLPRPGPCEPPQVRASVLTLAVERRAVTVVLVRDVGVPGALGEQTAERVLASAVPGASPG